MSCDRNELKYSFFNVVNIEEKLHFTRRMTKLRNVSLKILLDLLRKIAKPKGFIPRYFLLANSSACHFCAVSRAKSS